MSKLDSLFFKAGLSKKSLSQFEKDIANITELISNLPTPTDDYSEIVPVTLREDIGCNDAARDVLLNCSKRTGNGMYKI